MFFLMASVGFASMLSYAILSDQKTVRLIYDSKQSYLVADSAIEDMTYRYIAGIPPGATETIKLNGVSATSTSVFSNGTGMYTIASQAVDTNAYRKMTVRLRMGFGASFNYGLQSGTGGIEMLNSASVVGNVYSNGPVTGANSNIARGDVVSAGSSGLISGITATGSAYARTIQNSAIGKNAYYQTKISTTVGGVSYPGSSNQATATLPISDQMIEAWKDEAAEGGTISGPCPYIINTNTTIGPKKILCDVEVSGTNKTVNLGGPLWVTGNIIFKNSQTIKVATALGNKTIPIIADNPSNRLSSSKISAENSIAFQGSGTAGSYVLVISQNNSAETGGSQVAIDLKNSNSGALLAFAGHGMVVLQNNISLKEVAAYKIQLKNSAAVRYESGLANLLFTSGPGGGYDIVGWKEK